MSAKIFPTAQDAENAFYEALERADLDAMMAVWSEDEEIVCVHPAGQRLAGQAQVREAWRQMFAGGPGMRVQIGQQVVVDRHDGRGAQRARKHHRRGRAAAAAADGGDQRLPAHALGLAHDRAPRLARAGRAGGRGRAVDPSTPKILH